MLWSVRDLLKKLVQTTHRGLMFCSIIFNRWIWIWVWWRRRGLRLQAILTRALVSGRLGFTLECLQKRYTEWCALPCVCSTDPQLDGDEDRWVQWEGKDRLLRESGRGQDLPVVAVTAAHELWESVDRLSSVCVLVDVHSLHIHSCSILFVPINFFVLTPSCDSVSEYFKI